jgi:hypothetical protein
MLPTQSKTKSLGGMWEMVVTGFNLYHYKYAISDGSWVATGDVDEGFQGLKFSPTMGAYLPQEDRSFSYK